MRTSKGFVTLGSLFLSALVGLGGFGAVISFQHDSNLFNGLFSVKPRVFAALDVTPTPGIVPSPTQTPSLSPTPTPTPVVSKSGEGADVHEDSVAGTGIQENQDTNTEEQGVFGTHFNIGFHEGQEVSGGQE